MPIEHVTIRQIGDMTEWGFARALVTVQLTRDETGALPKIDLDIPLTYAATDTMAAVREKLYDRVIASLHDAVESLRQRPAPPLDKPQTAPPETPET